MTPSVLIRVAMLTGVLLFGGVIWFMQRSGQISTDTTAETARTLVLAGRIIWGAALGGCMVLFALTQRSPGRTDAFAIVAWALCEGVALFGGIVWYLTGQNQWWTSGVIFLVLSFLAFPGGRSRQGRRA